MIRKSFLLGLVLAVFSADGCWAEPTLELKEEGPRLVIADAASKDSLSVDDLGFSSGDLKSDLSQKDLDTRESMLKTHQILGLVTAIPMTTEFVLGIITAGNVSTGSTDVGLHTTLGIATVGLYATAAAFEIFAPKPKNQKHTGNTGIHETLSWIHLPLMVVVPLVGDMAADRIQNHQSLGNLGLVHGTLATVLLVSYLSSITVITF